MRFILVARIIHVTILFSDIRGFTRMSEHMEPHCRRGIAQ